MEKKVKYLSEKSNHTNENQHKIKQQGHYQKNDI
jgi:hypothetical protein